MKKLPMVLPLVLVLCLTFACEKEDDDVAEQPAVDIATEEAAIREVLETVDEAGRKKDVELYVSAMADDVFTSGGRDKDAIRAQYSDWFSKGNSWDNGIINKMEISSSGDMAYTICRWETFKEDGSSGTASGTIVWKKQADGSWKIVAL